MTWRTAIGLTPTQRDLAEDLLKAAERHGLGGWRHDAADGALRNGDRIINLANIVLEYAGASRLGRPRIAPEVSDDAADSAGAQALDARPNQNLSSAPVSPRAGRSRD